MDKCPSPQVGGHGDCGRSLSYCVSLALAPCTDRYHVTPHAKRANTMSHSTSDDTFLTWRRPKFQANLQLCSLAPLASRSELYDRFLKCWRSISHQLPLASPTGLAACVILLPSSQRISDQLCRRKSQILMPRNALRRWRNRHPTAFVSATVWSIANFSKLYFDMPARLLIAVVFLLHARMIHL